MPIEKYKLGTYAVLASTELNGLANNALALASAAYNNVQAGAGGDGYTLGDLELAVTFGLAPRVNTGVSVWLLSAADGVNYEDGSATVTPTRAPDCVFAVRAVATAQRLTRRVELPWGLFKALVKNDDTAQAFAAAGNALSIRPVTHEGV